MSVLPITRALIALAATSAFAQLASAATVFATDFNATTAGAYADLSVLNSGGVTTDNVTLRSNTGSATTVVDRGAGNMALQFTDNSADAAQTANPRAYSNTFGPLSTTASGENRLSGGFDYTRLLTAVTTATSPTFQFLANSGSATSPGGTVSAISLTVDSNGHVSYANGSTGVDTGFTLVTGTEYHFEFDSDFSSATQDTWSLTVTPVGSATPVIARTGINTRAPNVAVNVIAFLGGVNSTAISAAPFAQIDNINFASSAVPEPASLVAIAGGCVVALRRRRSQRI